jgi:hypothetical protein
MPNNYFELTPKASRARLFHPGFNRFLLTSALPRPALLSPSNRQDLPVLAETKFAKHCKSMI